MALSSRGPPLFEGSFLTVFKIMITDRAEQTGSQVRPLRPSGRFFFHFIASLAEMNHPAAIQLLAEAVRRPIREVRFRAAFELAGKHHDLRALPALIEALRCGNEEFEPWMISRLGEPAVPA